MKSKYLIAIIVSLLIINFVLIYKIFLLKRQIKLDFDISRYISLPIKYSPDFSLYDLNGIKYYSQKIIRNPYTLFVFFSPTDCTSCLFEKELWNKILKIKKVNILGIARHTDKKELNDWIANSEILFPVLYDENGEVTEKFGIKRTPLKILVNNEGKICFIDSVRRTSLEQKAFLKELEEILQIK